MEPNNQLNGSAALFAQFLHVFRKTVGRGIIISIVIMLPAIVLFMILFRTYVDALNFSSTSFLSGTYGAKLLSLCLTLLLIISTTWSELSCIMIAAGEMKDERESCFQAMKKGIGERFVSAFILTFFIFMVGILMMFIPFIATTALTSLNIYSTAITIGIVICSLCCLLFLLIRWYVALPLIADQNLGVLASLRESKKLVSGHWWEVLALVFLFYLVLNILIYLMKVQPIIEILYKSISVPIDGIKSLLNNFSLLSPWTHFFSTTEIVSTILITLVLIFLIITTSVFNTTLYFKLRTHQPKFVGSSLDNTRTQPAVS